MKQANKQGDANRLVVLDRRQVVLLAALRADAHAPDSRVGPDGEQDAPLHLPFTRLPQAECGRYRAARRSLVAGPVGIVNLDQPEELRWRAPSSQRPALP